MITIELDSSAGDGARSEAVLSGHVLAAIAAGAANAVPGVRTEPGIIELVSSVLRLARRPVLGLDPASTRGVRVEFSSGADGRAVTRVDLSVSVRGQARAVGQAVRAAVARALAEHADVPDAVVTVSIVDIELARGLG